ncbi:MAG: histidine--tRNA ligase, partial [Eubacterium sp.]|nr:histidine--tRNA ligase [Eubacterium sp.]
MALIAKAPKGTEDKLPFEIHKWHAVEKIITDIAARYGLKEIRTPTFEHTKLFQRGVGGTTDIVQKEMYTFKDKKGRSITLKPEGTAGAVRAAIEHGLINAALPQKLYYFTNCFRYEAPQSGRLREFSQFGAEVLGADTPYCDAELILFGDDIIKSLGVKSELQINSIGCPKCRKGYLKVLKDYFSDKKEYLCQVCLVRLERNPMRLLDCKNEDCGKFLKSVPVISDYLCNDCKENFDNVKFFLSEFGVKYTINYRLVRGLDYYTNTVFEFVSKNIGAQSALCAGGRYNGLVLELGGPNVPGIGFAMGLERMILAIGAEDFYFDQDKNCDIYIAGMDRQSFLYA